MAGPSRLQVSHLPGISAEEKVSTSSPARGAEYAASLRAKLFNNDSRVMSLVHSWNFWYEKPGSNTTSSSSSPPTSTPGSSAEYTPNLEELASISSVRAFWEVHNNFPLPQLPVGQTVHLFHTGTQPTWESPRNQRGGSLTYKIPPLLAADFWKEICLMAVGEQLQSAVEEEGRRVFRDDICGVSCGRREKGFVVRVWNRDAEHSAGIERLKAVIAEGLSEGLRPSDERGGEVGAPVYRRHQDHAAFRAQGK